jgi:transposase
MLMLSEKELDWLAERIPDAQRGAKGGLPPADKREVIAGIFWVLDNGAKWKDLPARFGSSTVHRWFLTRVKAGVFESLMQAAGRCGGRCRRASPLRMFHRWRFCQSQEWGDGIGCTRIGRRQGYDPV